MPKVICGKFSIERGKRSVSAKRELKKDKDQEIGRRRARGERKKEKNSRRSERREVDDARKWQERRARRPRENARARTLQRNRDGESRRFTVNSSVEIESLLDSRFVLLGLVSCRLSLPLARPSFAIVVVLHPLILHLHLAPHRKRTPRRRFSDSRHPAVERCFQ